MARARNAVILNTKGVAGGGGSNLGERAGSVLQFHVRIMVESDRKLRFNRFRQISLRFWTPSVAGAVFGDVGGRCLLLRIL